MIKEKELSEFCPQVRIQDGASITPQTVTDALRNCAASHGIPAAFDLDQVKTGGMIGGKTVDCVVLYHPEHRRDYFNLVATVQHQSSYAFIAVYSYGESKQMKKQDAAASAKAGAKGVGKSALHGILNGNDSIGGMFAGAAGMAKGTIGLARSIAKGIGSIGGSKEKLAEEQNWYAMVSDVFNEILA